MSICHAKNALSKLSWDNKNYLLKTLRVILKNFKKAQGKSFLYEVSRLLQAQPRVERILLHGTQATLRPMAQNLRGVAGQTCPAATRSPLPRTYPAPVEDGGRLQHPPSHVRHLIFDHDSKFTDVWICVETCASHLAKGKKKTHGVGGGLPSL